MAMGDAEDIQASCAICGGPGEPDCFCERDRLKISIDQAERRWKDTVLSEVRNTITSLSVTAVTRHYTLLSNHRRTIYKRKLASLPYYQHYVQRLPLHPSIIQTIRVQVEALDDELQQGLDEDWKNSVIRYPEVLDYYYGRIQFRMPTPDTPPPPGLLGPNPVAPGSPKAKRRSSGQAGMSGIGVPLAATPPKMDRPVPRRRGSMTPNPLANGHLAMPPQAPSVPGAPPLDWQSYAAAAGWGPARGPRY